MAACQGLSDDLGQVAAWFQSLDKLGLETETIWPHGGTYENLAQSDLLTNVKATLKRHQRWLS